MTPQHLQALARANEIRSARAALKREIKAKRCRVHEFLSEPPDYLHTLAIRDFLGWTPNWGNYHTDKTLKAAKVLPWRTIGELSEHQRESLVEVLTH